jgi:hypothetical protein
VKTRNHADLLRTLKFLGPYEPHSGPFAKAADFGRFDAAWIKGLLTVLASLGPIYQRQYYDDRFLDFLREGEEAVAWVRNLSSALGRFFLEWLDAHK